MFFIMKKLYLCGLIQIRDTSGIFINTETAACGIEAAHYEKTNNNEKVIHPFRPRGCVRTKCAGAEHKRQDSAVLQCSEGLCHRE